jgi:hypothetical protein
LVCLLGLSGCAGNYGEKSVRVRHYYRAGQLDLALRDVDDLDRDSRSGDLLELERGNLLLSAGRPAESEQAFAEVIEPYLRLEDNRPVIDLSGLPGGAMASTLGDDRSRPYRVPGYELVMALNYRALSFLFLGRLESAVVEMRRAARVQESIREAYPDEELPAVGDQVMMQDRVAEVMAQMEDGMRTTARSWNNAYVWWLSGVLREAYGESSVAQLDYQRAFELQRDQAVFRQDLLRLLQRNDPERYRQLVDSFPTGTGDVPDTAGKASVVVIYEESLIPLLRPDTFLLFWPGLHAINISVPLYMDPRYLPSVLRLQVDGGPGSDLQEAASLQALAYRSLQERMGGILWRNILRNLSRIALNEASEQGNENWEAAIKIFTLFKGVLEEADTRAWSTLPLLVQVGRVWVEPGQRRVEVNSRLGRAGAFELDLSPGDTGLILIRDTGGYTARYAVNLLRPESAFFQSGADSWRPVSPLPSLPTSMLPAGSAGIDKSPVTPTIGVY